MEASILLKDWQISLAEDRVLMDKEINIINGKLDKEYMKREILTAAGKKIQKKWLIETNTRIEELEQQRGRYFMDVEDIDLLLKDEIQA